MDFPRGAIHEANARVGGPVAEIQHAKVVVPALVEHAALDDGTGGDDPHHLPLDQPLGGGGILHLLADRDLISLGHQAGDIGFAGMEGYAAHRRPFLLPAVLAREHQLEFLRRDLRVVEKHLIEVAQPEKQQALGMLGFDLEILPHHRGNFIYINIFTFHLYHLLKFYQKKRNKSIIPFEIIIVN